MASPRVAVFTATVLTAFALCAASASAAISWSGCTPAGFQCGTLTVPLDRGGELGGTVTLHAARKPAGTTQTTTAVLALAGGPGQAALPFRADFASALAPALTTRDLLVYDQRGTGTSNPLRCAAFSQSGSQAALTAKCASQLGLARGRFTTIDSADDIESLRVAAGYSKLVLYGVSYGTKVALAYAARYPTRVAGLVLDSVVTPEGPDGLNRSTLGNVARVLRDLCAGSECSDIATDPVGDVRKLARKLAKRDVKGSVYSPRGRRYTARLSEPGLLRILVAGDLNPTLRAEFPGSVRAALKGDPRPILRLSARASGLTNAVAPRTAPIAWQDSTGVGEALYVVTVCEDATSIPWTRGASLATRQAQVIAAVRGLPASQTDPFSNIVALDSLPATCLGYPVAAPAPNLGPVPDVPTLIVNGGADLRTPLTDATSVKNRISGAQLVSPAHAGHSVLGSDQTGCADAALASFFSGRPVAACGPSDNVFSPTPRPPARFSDVRTTPGTSAKVSRTINAVLASNTDARRQLIGEALAFGQTPTGAGGLRGGYTRPSGSSGHRLVRYQYVPGVIVSGTVSSNGAISFTVTGAKAAHGTVKVTSGGALTARLDGRTLSASLSRARIRGADVPPTDATASWATLAARGRLVAAAQ